MTLTSSYIASPVGSLHDHDVVQDWRLEASSFFTSQACFLCTVIIASLYKDIFSTRVIEYRIADLFCETKISFLSRENLTFCSF